MRLVITTLVLGLGGAVGLADWTRFRGPNGLGTSSDASIPMQWSETKNLVWRRDIPGVGHSSPIVSKGKIFLQSSSEGGDQRMLICLNEATGVVEWTKTVAGEKAHTHKKNSLASSTPAADDQQIYCIFWTGKKVLVYAYDYSGQEKWQTELGGYVSQHGVGMSPVVHDGQVYVNYDQDGAAEFVCLSAKDGSKLWTKTRKAYRACYTNPLIRTLPTGQTEIVLTSTTALTGYDAKTGEINWNQDWKFSGMPLRTIAAPLLIENTLIQFSGDGGGSRAALALSLADQKPTLLWELKRDTPYVPGGVIFGDHLYAVTDAGLATCLEHRTGKIVWQERLFTKPISASLVLIGANVLAIAEDGKAIAFKATAQGLEKVGESNLGEAVFATPAVANGRLYIRSASKLWAIGTK